MIPRWATAMLRTAPPFVNGDGGASSDFCLVANAVQANLLAATVEHAGQEVHSVAVGEQTMLLELHAALARELRICEPSLEIAPPGLRKFQAGDVRHRERTSARRGACWTSRMSSEIWTSS